MKKYLLPNTNSYKANLHCHTTISDGSWTPEKVKEEYSKRGYSIVAYTDHNMMIDHHQELSDDTFLALRGFEVQISEPPNETPVQRSCHICAIALEPDNLVQPCWNEAGFNHWRYYKKPAVDTVFELRLGKRSRGAYLRILQDSRKLRIHPTHRRGYRRPSRQHTCLF